MPARRFPPPWSVEEFEACFVVKDSSGQKLGYLYYEDTASRASDLSPRLLAAAVTVLVVQRALAGVRATSERIRAEQGDA
jgi:hypothetical protein